MDFLTLFDFYRKLNDATISVEDVSSIVRKATQPHEYRAIINLGIRQYLNQKSTYNDISLSSNDGLRNSQLVNQMYDKLRKKYKQNAINRKNNESENDSNANVDDADITVSESFQERSSSPKQKQNQKQKQENKESKQDNESGTGINSINNNSDNNWTGLQSDSVFGSGSGSGGINTNTNTNMNGNEIGFVGFSNYCKDVLNTQQLNCKIFSFLDLESLMQCSVVCVNWLFDSYHPSSIGYLNTKMIVKYVDSSDITPAMVLNFNNLMFGSLKSPKKQDSASSSSSDSDDTDEKKEEMVDNSQTQQV